MHTKPRVPVALTLVLFLLPASVIAQDTEPAKYTEEDFFVTSPDGTEIAATVYTPEGTGPFAAVLMTHGWPGHRLVDYVRIRAERFAENGFLVVAYDSRGYGDSGGETTLDGPLEIEDAITLVSHIATLPNVMLDGAQDPRVGLFGRSYAGGLAQLAAMNDPRIDAVVAEHTWNNLLQALVPNDVVEVVWVNLLFAGGQSHTHGVALGSTNSSEYNPDATGGASPKLTEWYTVAMTQNEANEEMKNEIGVVRSIDASRIRVPTMFVQGWNDTLFDASHAIKSFTALYGGGIPAKLVLFNGGHGLSPPWESEQALQIESRIDAWLDLHLRGDEASTWVRDWPVESWEHWSQKFQGETDWPSFRTRAAFYYLNGTEDAAIAGGGTLDLTPSYGETVRLAQAPAPTNYVEFPNYQTIFPHQEQATPGTNVVFATPPLENETRLLGAPFAYLTLNQEAPTGEVIIMTRLVDIAPDGTATTVLKQVTPIRVEVPQQPGALAVAPLEMSPVSYRFQPGHRIGFGVSTNDPAFGASRQPNAIGIKTETGSISAVMLPILDTTMPADPFPPFVSVTGLLRNAEPGTDVAVTAIASDNVAIANVTLEVSFGGAVLGSQKVARPPNGEVTLPVALDEVGTYTFRAVAEDVSGMTSESVREIQVEEKEPEPTQSSEKNTPGLQTGLLAIFLGALALVRRRTLQE